MIEYVPPCYALFHSYGLLLTTNILQPHGNDMLAFAMDNDFMDYLIQFVATLDPNGVSGAALNGTVHWPQYDPAARQMLFVLDGEEPLVIGLGDVREEVMAGVAALSLKYPV